MPERKNLCAMIPIELHQQVSEAKDAAGMTIGEYMTKLITEYYELKKNGGSTNMTGNTRTMAFQIPEDLFQRIKAYLERETARTGKKLTQREFVLGLIERALDDAEQALMISEDEVTTENDGNESAESNEVADEGDPGEEAWPDPEAETDAEDTDQALEDDEVA